MSEPKRWLEGGGPLGAADLLHAGLAERPSRRSVQRTWLAVSAMTVGAVGATAQAATSSVLLFAGKCAAIGVVSATVIVSTAVGVGQYRARTTTPTEQVRRAERTQTPSPEPAPSKPKPIEPGQAQQSTEAATVRRSQPAHAAAPTTAVKPIVAPLRATKTSALPKLAAAPAPDAPDIPEQARAIPTAESSPTRGPDMAVTREIAWIDAARNQLRIGNASQALQEIVQYEAGDGSGHFAPEALYLRMEAQMQLGNAAAAARTARELLRRFPESPQAKRAAEVLRSSTEQKF